MGRPEPSCDRLHERLDDNRLRLVANRVPRGIANQAWVVVAAGQEYDARLTTPGEIT